MESLRIPKPKKYSAAIEAQHARYISKVQQAERETEKMLRAIHAASRPKGTPYDEQDTLTLISRHLHAAPGATFYEAVAVQYFWALHPHAPFYW